MTSGLCRAKPSLRVPSSSSLFLEATQRKTVRTVIAVLRADPIEVEAQEVGVATPRRNRRRPAVPVAADVPQHTGAVHAEARGGAARHTKTGFFSYNRQNEKCRFGETKSTKFSTCIPYTDLKYLGLALLRFLRMTDLSAFRSPIQWPVE